MEQGGQHEGPPLDAEVRTPAPASTRGPARRTLRRQLAVSFGVVGALGILLCGVLLLLVASVGSALDTVQEDAESTRLALGLSLAVREQYIHEAHTILEGNATHLHHHDRWVRRAQEGATELEGRAPSAAAGRARRVAEASADLDAVFAERIVPPAMAGDEEAVRTAHGEAENLARRAQAEADALVAALDQRVAVVHDQALARSRLALGISVLGTLMLVFVSALLFARLRRSLVRPLRSLTAAAAAVSAGRESVELQLGAQGEVATVAVAFEGMRSQLQRRGQELVRAERMAALGELAQAVAGAIREPCDRVRDELHAMRSRPAYEDMRGELDILSEEVDACHRIVDDLLAWAQAPELAREEQDVAEVIHSAVERFRSTELGRAIELEADAESCSLWLDAVRVRQVLANLLRNASRASPGGSVRVEGHLAENDRYRVSVTDDGPGVPPEQLPRLFEPFYTGHQGTGLGLAVCHGIVAAHGGAIFAEVRSEGGLSVSFELPRRPTS